MEYSQALDYLYRAHERSGIKLGLERMEAISTHLGNPEKKFQSIHIAGTNGKGSTATKIAEGLYLAGHKVGLFTSPHISTFRERIQINHQLIEKEAIISYLKQIQEVEKALGLQATFFELTTLIAFLHFAKENVDWAAVETGLGGRLDATNILVPKLSIITSISFDHMEILGSSLEAIAGEKAGILKHKIPLLIGPHVPIDPIQKTALKKDSPLFKVEGNFDTFDEENSAIAKKALEYLRVKKQKILGAIAKRPPCRIETFTETAYSFPVVLDVAHNPDGLTRLFKSLKTLFPQDRFSVILGLSKSKDIYSCLKIVAKEAQAIYLVEASSPRAATSSFLSQALTDIGYDRHCTCSSIQEALFCTKNPTLISGTFFIMGEARKALGLSYPSDPIDLNEPFAIVEKKEGLP